MSERRTTEHSIAGNTRPRTFPVETPFGTLPNSDQTLPNSAPPLPPIVAPIVAVAHLCFLLIIHIVRVSISLLEVRWRRLLLSARVIR